MDSDTHSRTKAPKPYSAVSNIKEALNLMRNQQFEVCLCFVFIFFLPARAANSFEALNNVLPQLDHPIFVNRGLSACGPTTNFPMCDKISRFGAACSSYKAGLTRLPEKTIKQTLITMDPSLQCFVLLTF